MRELRLLLEPREVRTLTISLEVGRVEVSLEVAGNIATIPGTHSPSSTTLTADRLESMPVFQRTNLPDAIVTLAPGMIRGHDDFVHIRGHEVALNPLINGVSFWENTHVMFSAGVSPDVIETANVMTGGFPAEYGNRFGGVVDIVTRSGLRMENRGAVNVSGGGAGRRAAGAEIGGSRGRFGYFVVGSVLETDRFISPPAPEAIHDRARGGHAFVQFEASLGTSRLGQDRLDGRRKRLRDSRHSSRREPAADGHRPAGHTPADQPSSGGRAPSERWPSPPRSTSGGRARGCSPPRGR